MNNSNEQRTDHSYQQNNCSKFCLCHLDMQSTYDLLRIKKLVMFVIITYLEFKYNVGEKLVIQVAT